MRPNDRARWYALYRSGLSPEALPQWLADYPFEEVLVVFAHDLRHQVSFVISWSHLWRDEVNWEHPQLDGARDIRELLDRLISEATVADDIISEAMEYYEDSMASEGDVPYEIEVDIVRGSLIIFDDMRDYTDTLRTINDQLLKHPHLMDVTLDAGDKILHLDMLTDTVEENTAMLHSILDVVRGYGECL
ncbi:MAG: hypothetical protein GYB65_24280 [Chloroflexi bacterium]|nr:hypothetical protein [Chloroflexota bacterium]